MYKRPLLVSGNNAGLIKRGFSLDFKQTLAIRLVKVEISKALMESGLEDIALHIAYGSQFRVNFNTRIVQIRK